MSRNGKIPRDEGGGTALSRIEVKEMIRTENLWWNKENYCDAHTFLAKSMFFWETGIRK
jgi:hypothetical protein